MFMHTLKPFRIHTQGIAREYLLYSCASLVINIKARQTIMPGHPQNYSLLTLTSTYVWS